MFKKRLLKILYFSRIPRMTNFGHRFIYFTSVRKQKPSKTKNFKIRETCLLRFYADNDYLRLIWKLRYLFFFNFTVNIYMDRILFVWNVQGTLFIVIKMIEFLTTHRTNSQNVHQANYVISLQSIYMFLSNSGKK